MNSRQTTIFVRHDIWICQRLIHRWHRTHAEDLLEGFQGKGNSRVQDDGAGHFHLAESIGHCQPSTVWPPLCHHHTELYTLQRSCFVKYLLTQAHNHIRTHIRLDNCM